MHQLGELERDYPQFVEKGVQLVTLAYQNQDGVAKTIESTGATYPVLADVDHAVADQYGVFNLLGDGVATPAVFIIDQNGQIIWSYIGSNISDRPANQTILQNLPG